MRMKNAWIEKKKTIQKIWKNIKSHIGTVQWKCRGRWEKNDNTPKKKKNHNTSSCMTAMKSFLTLENLFTGSMKKIGVSY